LGSRKAPHTSQWGEKRKRKQPIGRKKGLRGKNLEKVKPSAKNDGKILSVEAGGSETVSNTGDTNAS